MPQYSPDLVDLNIGDFTATWDRGCFFPAAESELTIQGIDIYMQAGSSVRAAIYNSGSAETINGAALVIDFGVVTNDTGSDGFVTVSAPAGTKFPAGGYPVIVQRQSDVMALVGAEDFPVGDAIFATRSYNEEELYTTSFPSVAFDDDGTDQSFRIPYVRLNYEDADSGLQIISINNGQPVRAGATSIPLVASEGFTPTSGTIGGIPVNNIQGVSPNFTFDMPAPVAGGSHPYYGNKTAVFTDGVDSAQLDNVPYAPAAGRTYVTLSGTVDTSENGVVHGFIDPAAEAGHQIEHPDTFTVNPDATVSPGSVPEGTHPMAHIADGKYRTYSLIVGEEVIVVPPAPAPILESASGNLKLLNTMTPGAKKARLGDIVADLQRRCSAIESAVAALEA